MSEEKSPVLVPPEQLSSDILNALIESFILREGTDYGAVEVSHETKVRQIQTQLKKDQIKIIFDPNTETVTLMTTKDWQRLAKALPPVDA